MSGFILLVDDNDDLREMLRSALEFLGHEVMTASNGADAVQKVVDAGKSPSLVLLDLQMPVMDGAQFLDSRTSEPLLQTVPVVVMTAQRQDLVPGLPGADV